jgi:hypothetical protein
MKIKKLYIFIVVVVISIIAALTMSFTKIETKTVTNKIMLPSIDDVPKKYWVKLSEKKIFFGHKSVGYNIIEGIKDIIKERDYIKLNIVETNEPAEFDKPVFAHSQVGKNTEPASKTEGFKNIIDSGVGEKLDIAFFKFCYVDVMQDSDPQKIFENYKTAIEYLKARYPKTKFMHVTVPVRSLPKGLKKTLKESIKLLIGKPGVLDDNIKRQNYNTLLNEAYPKTEPVFDLALIESVNPDGLRCYATQKAEKVFFMSPEYTEDGGHLNEKGRKIIAEQLLISLTKIANEL